LPWWLWMLKLLQGDRTWLRVHELWLPEIRANLVRHWGCDVLLGFWAPFSVVPSSMILTVEVQVPWIVIRESWRSSSSSPSSRSKSSARAWSTALVRLRISTLLMFRGFWDCGLH
jgi:hypothetical protein